MSPILKQILDYKASVLRDYIIDLETELKDRKDRLTVAEKLEQGSDDLSNAVCAGVNDYLHRNMLDHLQQELTKAKFEFQLTVAELLDSSLPQSKYNIAKIRAIPIKDFINRFTILKGTNGNLAICPIHREKTPSLHIYEDTNSWYCFGHNNGGSIIDFVMQLNEYTLNEALDYLNKII